MSQIKVRTPDEVREFFNSHWTVRKYKSVAMPPEHLDVILEAAQRAPTDATAQMYSFIRLTDPELKKQIAQLSNNPHIATASEAFIICADIHRLDEILKSQSFKIGEFPNIAIHFAIGDAVLAGQSMLIAAEMLGYRGCWIGGIISALQEVSALVKLPKGVFPFAALTIGVPNEDPVHRPRLPRKMMVHENTYQTPLAEELTQAIDEMAKITQRGNWAQTLNGYFGEEGSMVAREKRMTEYLNQAGFKK